MDDAWLSGDPYEYYMGRWSSRVAESFIDWLSLSPGLEWLDIGCGSGALSEAVINKHNPDNVTAIDQSEGFVKTAQKRLGNRVNCRVGNAFELPLEDASVNAAISGLVLNFLPEPEKALIEMKRVTMPGGSVAVYVWDYAGKMDLLNYFWDTAVELNPKAFNLHEGRRFPDTDSVGLKDIFKRAGFSEIETAPLEINTDFHDFDDYWQPFLGGQGPAPTYVLSLDEPERDKLRHALLERLPIQADGSIPMVARAWAAKSIVDE
jgi:SAM-dependent methyltransferase